MTELSASEKRRISAAIKRWKTSDNFPLKRLIQRPHPPLAHRQFVQSFTQLMEKAGVDVRKLNESIRRGRRKDYSSCRTAAPDKQKNCCC